MLIRLKYIEIFNFKSFAGRHVVGPFMHFGAVVGPNGSGKSNMMDAVCFVMGEKAANLRVRKLQDLVHGANTGEPLLSEYDPFVAAVFEEREDAEIRFSRSIHGSTSVYKVNSSVVDAAQYLERLQRIGVVIKSKNFIVVQDQMQSLVLASARERTELFEHMSRSIEFKEDYDRAKERMNLAEKELNSLFKKKKVVFTEKKVTKLEADDARKYDQLCSKLEEVELKLRLFKLNQNELEQKQISNEVEMQSEALDVALDELRDAKEQLGALKRDRGRSNRDAVAQEKIWKQLESEMMKKQGACIRAKERTGHAITKLQSARKALAIAEKAFSCHKRDVLELNEEMKEVLKRRDTYVDHFKSELEAQGGQAQLDDAQITEYQKLKEKAARDSGNYLTEVNSFEIQLKSDNAQLENERRQRDDLLSQIKVVEQQRDFRLQRIKKLNDYISTSQKKLEELETAEVTLSSEIAAACSRMDELDKETEQILIELKDITDDKSTSTRYVKKMELIENLKRLFSGVYGRLVDYCHPVHSKYKVAVTKVMGRHLESVVCDSHVTATNCIRYMKDQRFEAETFLPLDYIKVKIIDEKLREISDPKNVKLVFDVLSFDMPQMKAALLFACGNTLVCETVDDARKVAYGLDTRHQAVSLDGVLFQKNGLISGGTSDLEARARRWDGKELNLLKKRKQDVLDELNRLRRVMRKKSELVNIRSQIDGLKSRVKFSTIDRNNVRNVDATEAEKHLAELQQQLASTDGLISEMLEQIARRTEQIQMTKREMERIEDGVFALFCLRVGVKNIRQYEENYVKLRRQHDEKLLEFDNHVMRLQSQIQFEETRTAELSANVEKWRKLSADEDEKVEQLKAEEETLFQAANNCKEKTEASRSLLASLRSEVDRLDSDISLYYKSQLAEKQDALDSIKKLMVALDTKMVQKKAERHNLLKSFKFGSIPLPLAHGSLDDIEFEDSSQEENGTGASMSSDRAPEIYSKEALLEVDFSLLGSHRNVVDKTAAQKLLEDLEEELISLRVQLERLPRPNLAASDRFVKVKSQCKDAAKEFETVRGNLQRFKKEFDRIKKLRYTAFMKCFDEVSQTIDEIYKTLSRNLSAQAVLSLDDDDEPYLGGISFSCIAPGKRFLSMDNLSGGEKTLAALALLFTLYSCCSAPFLILDEIDASLDNSNILKVVGYIRNKAADMQCIVITHKKEFYNSAEQLYGFYIKKSDEEQRSHLLTLDLMRYVQRPFSSPTEVTLASLESSHSEISAEE